MPEQILAGFIIKNVDFDKAQTLRDLVALTKIRSISAGEPSVTLAVRSVRCKIPSDRKITKIASPAIDSSRGMTMFK